MQVRWEGGLILGYPCLSLARVVQPDRDDTCGGRAQRL